MKPKLKIGRVIPKDRYDTTVKEFSKITYRRADYENKKVVLNNN